MGQREKLSPVCRATLFDEEVGDPHFPSASAAHGISGQCTEQLQRMPVVLICLLAPPHQHGFTVH
jgi:hypothetical protein